MGEYKTSPLRVGIAVVFVILSLAMLILGSGMVLTTVNGETNYRKDMGDYITNAADAGTFQEQIHWLQLFNDSMNKGGLTAEMYGAPTIFYWDRTPQNQMAYQYYYITHLIVNRIPIYINASKFQNCYIGNDCYEKLINSSRNEINRDGGSDWVAHPAYQILHGYYWDAFWGVWVIIGGVICLIVGVVILIFARQSYHPTKYEDN